METKTIALPGVLERLQKRKAGLEVTSGPAKGARADVEGLILRVGSAPDNDLIVDDPTVSKHHFRIEFHPDGYRISDLNSKNGLRIGGVRITQAWLPDDCRIEAGTAMLRFRLLKGESEELVASGSRLGRLLGQSLAMRRLFAELQKLATGSSTVLIEGESGTGKELAAETLHELSPRAAKPFVVFDCGAVSESLLESQLFGHRRGAFTGASEHLSGAVERADGGTLFIDEIGELPFNVQAKLLRVIDKNQYQPLGADSYRSSDVRIVAATNRNLKREVLEGRFREDLYFRMAVIRLRVPALRERPEDIPLLVDHFVEELSARMPGGAGAIRQVRVRDWARQEWPGNVRELRNAVERELVLGGDDEPAAAAALAGHAPESFFMDADGGLLPYKDAKQALMNTFERDYWTALLEQHGGNITKAAEAGGVHRKSLEYLLRKLGISARGE